MFAAETSLKSATYGGSYWMPQGISERWMIGSEGFNGPMLRDATGQGYDRGWCNQRPCMPGRFRYFRKPGGIAGAWTNFIIGGSQWETGADGYWKTDAEAKAFADAGFLAVSFSIPADGRDHGGDGAGLASALKYATAHGMFVLATPQLQSSKAVVLSRAAVLKVAEDFSCHTNFAGFVLAGNYSAAGTDAKAVVAAANAMVSVVG